MANGKILFKTNISKLQKVRFALQASQTMDSSQVVLHGENEEKRRQVVALLSKAETILNEIK